MCTQAPCPLKDVTFGEGTFVAVGDNGTILTSTNGYEWTPRPPATNEILLSVAYGNKTFIAVGQHGTILQSEPSGTIVEVSPPKLWIGLKNSDDQGNSV